MSVSRQGSKGCRVISGGAATGCTLQVTSWVYGPLVTDLVQQCDSQEYSRKCNSILLEEEVSPFWPLLDGECDLVWESIRNA